MTYINLSNLFFGPVAIHIPGDITRRQLNGICKLFWVHGLFKNIIAEPKRHLIGKKFGPGVKTLNIYRENYEVTEYLEEFIRFVETMTKTVYSESVARFSIWVDRSEKTDTILFSLYNTSYPQPVIDGHLTPIPEFWQ